MTPAIQLSELRKIGWSSWNPIGLSRPGQGESGDDEYDAYLLDVADRLLRGGPRAEAVDFLVGVECNQMGLSGADASARARATVDAIASYVRSLAPDSKKPRS